MKIDLSDNTDMNYKPNLYDIHSALDQEIVGEHRARMSLFTNFVLAEKFVLMAGPRSSGKTWISDHIRDYFLGDIEKGTGTAYSMTSGSKKAGWYQIDKINRASHIFIFELNQMPEEFEEVLKQWGEGKDASYKVTVQQQGIRTVQNYSLKRKPTIFCLADEDEKSINEQLYSRITLIRTDSSIEQNKRVMKNQASLVRIRDNPKKLADERLLKLKEHISTLPPFDDFEYKHPASELFVNAIPPFFTDCRRDFPKYLDNTFGVTRYYWKERIRINRGKSKAYIFVTPADMFLNHIIYGQTLIESALKCSSIERDMIEIVKSLNQEVDRATVQRNLRTMGYNVSSHMCTKHLNQLADIGYLDRVKVSGTDKYVIGDLFNEFSFSINWKEVIEESKKNITKEFPEIAEAYIKNYCEDPIVVHPFSGQEIHIKDIKETKIDLAEKRTDLKFFLSIKDQIAESKKEALKDKISEEITDIEAI